MIEVYYSRNFNTLMYVKNNQFLWADHILDGYTNFRSMSDYGINKLLNVKLFEIEE